MIGEGRPATLNVRADAATVPSTDAISLGLIVTELVINALKHAFPSGAGGHITVGYTVAGSEWSLNVSDDGVGMPPPGETPARAGLGSSIVQALATQLGSLVVIADRHPGTAVSISGKLDASGAHLVGPALAV